MQPVTLEFRESLDLWHGRGGQTARGHDAEASGDALATVGANVPAVRGLVIIRGGDARAEAQVAPQIQAVGDEPEVCEDLLSRGETLRPGPLLLQRLREGIGVVDA